MSLLDSLHGLALTGRISVPTVVDQVLGRASLERCDERLRWWSRKLVEDAEIELTVRGSHHGGDGTEPLVVMSNHQSFYDIPVLFCAVPGRLRMVAKRELYQVPIFGAAMRSAGFIEIDRQNRARAIESLGASRQLLERGIRVWIAPEGTRSPSGKLGPFKSGGFHLALAEEVRILPVALDGTREVLPAHALSVRKGKHVTATLLPPIDTREFGPSRKAELMAAVEAAIRGALPGA